MTQNLNKWKIDAIFEKDKQGNYTNDALLCQDILLYCLGINKTALENNPFKLRDLQRWIVQNNKEIREYYEGPKAHTSLPNKIHAKEDRINNKFEGLRQLRLIRESIAKTIQLAESLYVDAKVTYQYTKGGIFLALTIKGMNLKKVIAITKGDDSITKYRKELEKTYQGVYDSLVNLAFKVNDNSPSNDIFYSTLFKKCKNRGIFDKFVDRIHYIIDNRDDDIVSIVYLFESVVNFAFFDKQNSETDFLDVLNETIEELDQEVRKLILYRIKIFTETKYQNKQEDLTREYEEFRFRLRSDYKLIAIQGYCESCKSKQNLALHYSDLISRRVNCPICNTNQILLD